MYNKQKPHRLPGAVLASSIVRASLLAALGRLHDGLPTVAATLGANTMGDMVFATGFTQNQMIESQSIMRAPVAPAATRNFAFGQRTHEFAPSTDRTEI